MCDECFAFEGSNASDLAEHHTAESFSHGGEKKGAMSDFCYDGIIIGVLISRSVISPGAENEMDWSGTEAIGTRCNFRMQIQH